MVLYGKLLNTSCYIVLLQKLVNCALSAFSRDRFSSVDTKNDLSFVFLFLLKR